jgi:quercetin dioxygenase-like cupin family protein
MTLVVAQPVNQRPPAGKPVTFGEGVRARDPLSPTPQYTLLAPGLYTRQIVQAASARGDYTVQVWSLLVSPRANTAEAKLPGAAVVTLYAGRVELITGEQKTRLEPGASATVPEGASLRFVNTDEKRPAQLRAVVLSGNP